MQFDLEDPGGFDPYVLVTHMITPRPIAWVSTLGPEGIVNLAPFSYFGVVSDEPVILMLSIGRRDGVPKDTAHNLLSCGEAVVHVVEEALFEPMVLSSKELPPDQSELSLVGLSTVASTRVAVPRLARASMALECKLLRHMEVGNEPNDVFFLRAICAHVADAAMSDGLPDATRLRVVGKLGGASYAVTEFTRAMKRP